LAAGIAGNGGGIDVTHFAIAAYQSYALRHMMAISETRLLRMSWLLPPHCWLANTILLNITLAAGCNREAVQQ